MTSHIIEIVEFELKEGVTTESLVLEEEKGKTYKDILRRYEVSCCGFGISI